jgi:hypothetical protein
MTTAMATMTTAVRLCLDAEWCAGLAQQHQTYLNRVLPTAQDLHEAFLAYEQHAVAVTFAAATDMFSLKLRRREVLDIIDCCEPIEAVEGVIPAHLCSIYGSYGKAAGPLTDREQRDTQDLLTYTMVIAGFCEARDYGGSSQEDRPIHVLCRLHSRPPRGAQWAMTILKVYAPSANRWTNNFSSRSCFCLCH